MSHVHTDNGTPVRASDAERERAAELLRAGYADGRLTRDEFDERLAVAYAAKTRADLRGLTSDLPGIVVVPAGDGQLPAGLPFLRPEPGTGPRPDWCLLLCLLFAFPPAGIAYWILTDGRQAQAAVPGRSRCPVPAQGDDAGREREP